MLSLAPIYYFRKLLITKILNTERKTKTHNKGKFNPDHYNVQDWVRLGFSERQSESILKYKKYLGAAFSLRKSLKNALSLVKNSTYNLLLSSFFRNKNTDKPLIKGLKPKTRSILIHLQHWNGKILASQKSRYKVY